MDDITPLVMDNITGKKRPLIQINTVERREYKL